MKKIYIILVTIFLFPIKLFSYTIEYCDYENYKCPSYIIGKVISEPIIKIIDKDNGQLEEGISYIIKNNRFFLFNESPFEVEFSGSILNYSNRNILNGEIINKFYIPNKGDIIIYNQSELGSIKKYKNSYFDLESKYSYTLNGIHIRGKNEYELLKIGTNDEYLVNENLNNFNIIYCENDIILLKKHSNKHYNIYLPYNKKVKFGNIPKLNTNEDFSNDLMVKPRTINEYYTEKDLITDLQYLAPCSNFNKIFGLNDNSNKIKEVNEEKINLKENKNILLEYFYKFIDFLKNLF